MKHSEMFALRMYLTSFPENDTFDEVLAKLDTGHIDITVWKPFQIYDANQLSEFILDSVQQIESQFFPLHELITVIDKDTVRVLFLSIVGRIPFSDELTRLCATLDTDLSFQLRDKIADALKLLNIKTNT
jgi:hypothetical protein